MLERYNIVKELGRTAHSAVYLVEHRQLSILRVAKLISKECRDYNRILREASLIKNLKHSGIPLVYDVEEDDVSIYIIEEYIAGKSLSEYVSEGLLKGERQLIDIAVKLCEILEFLHDNAGIIHMDIKPENIIICEEDGKPARITLIDFDSSVRRGEIVKNNYGTVDYAAPEQYESVCDVSRSYACESNPQTDVYGMGMLIKYMIDNCHIQSGTSKNFFGIRRYSKSVMSVIERCTRHNLNQRYKSVTELKLDLLGLTRNYTYTNRNNQIITIKSANSTDNARHIYVYGRKRGVGVTHFCLCLCSLLNKTGRKSVCIRHTDTEDFSALVREGKLLDNGAYKMRNIYIIPEYNGCVDFKTDSYEYIIHDYGMIEESSVRGFVQGQNKEVVYICNKGYRVSEEAGLYKLPKDTIVFVNHISGRDFYQFAKKHKALKKVFRIPCIYDWHKGNQVFEEEVRKALGIN